MRLLAFLLVLGCTSAMAADPSDQAKFQVTIATFTTRWLSTNNEIEREALVAARATELKDALGNAVTFSNWEMLVAQVALNGQGHAELVLIAPGSGPRFGLTNGAIDQEDRIEQAFRPGTNMFILAAALQRDQRVYVSGEFLLNARQHYLEASEPAGVKPSGPNFTTPLFIAHFSEIKTRL